MNKLAKITLISMFLIVGISLLIIIPLVFSTDPPKESDWQIWKRTATQDIYRNTKTGEYQTTIGRRIINYNDFSRRFPNYTPINTTLIQNQTELYGVTYDYYRDLNLYQAYFKEKSGTTPPWTRPVAVVKDGYILTLAPTSLKFTGQTNTHMQQSTATIENNIITYPNQFKNIDLKYNYGNTQLKEELIIDSLDNLKDIKASPSGDLILKIKVRSYNIDSSISMNMKINNQKVNFDNIEETKTDDAIYFLDENNETIYYFKKPIAYDSSGDQINLNYSIESNLFGNLVVKVFTPYEWLQNAVYPVYIDPTVTLQTADTENLADTHINSDYADMETSGDDVEFSISPYDIYGLIKFNISQIPFSVIDNATLSLVMKENQISGIAGRDNITVWAHHIYTFPYYNCSNLEWNDTINTDAIPTWNRRPMNSSQYNSAFESFVFFDKNSDEDIWYNWSVKNMVQTAIEKSDDDISIYLNATGSAVNSLFFWSKEYAEDTSLRPKLEITYTPRIDIASPTPSQTFTEDNPTTEFNITTAVNMSSCYWSDGNFNLTMDLYGDGKNNVSWGLSNITMMDGSHANTYFGCNESDNTWRTSDTVSFDVDSVNITTCRDLTVENRIYSLINNIIATDTCINLQTNNVTLDCDNYYIQGPLDGNDNSGISQSSSYHNSTIQNCNITHFRQQIGLGGDENTIKNFRSKGGSLATLSSIELTGNNNLLDNITISDYSGIAINGIIFTSSSYNQIWNSSITNIIGSSSGDGTEFSQSSHNELYQTILTGSTTDIQSVSASVNNTLVNATFTTTSVSADNDIHIKWYLDINVTDSSSDPIYQASVTIYDKDGNNALDVAAILTKATGFTDTQTLEEYNNTGGTKYYKTNYEINVSKTGYTLNSTSFNLTSSSWHHVTLYTEEENVAPSIIITHPQNRTYTFDIIDLNYTFTETNPAYCSYSYDGGSTNSSPVAMGTNFTGLTSSQGNNTWHLFCNDTIGNLNISSVTFFKDDISPNCTLISIVPADIEADSHGLLELIINCSDDNGLNLSRVWVTRTVEGLLTPGIPNYWSVRPPENDKAETQFAYKIFLADGRGDNKEYDSYEVDGNSLFADNFTYTVVGNDSIYLTLTLTSETDLLINFSRSVESDAFRNHVYLSRGMMEKAEKFNQSIYKNHGILYQIWDVEQIRGNVFGNYTIHLFNNLWDGGSPKDLLLYYCNSSYGKSGDPDADISCGYITAFDETMLLPANLEYQTRNSSYQEMVYAVTNGKIGGIVATNISYIYMSTQANKNLAYQFQYANSSSGTNIRFNDSQTAWYTEDNGVSFIQLNGTFDTWFAYSKSGDITEFGVYIEDSLGNNLTNFTLVTDEIGDVNFPISKPMIKHYCQGTGETCLNGEDWDLNRTYYRNMSIHLGTAIDPNSVGNVTHNLTLHNIDGTLAYVVNASFLSLDDSDIHIDFDTTFVLDGYYRLNVTAIAGDNAEDTKSFMQDNNFTIDNTFPSLNITSPANISYTTADISLNYSVSDLHLESCWYSNDSGKTNHTLACGDNVTLTWDEGTNIVYMWANDSVNHINDSEFITFYIDTSVPTVKITEPQNVSYTYDIIDLNYSFTETDPAYCSQSYDGGGTNSSPVMMGANFTGLTSSEGNNTWTLFCNDSVGHLNISSVTFFKDTITPSLNITSPANITYTYTDVPINYSVFDTNLQACWYSNDTGETNHTLTCGNNVTLTWDKGSNTLFMWANDTAGNINDSEVVNFVIQTDILPPTVNITTPQNISYSRNVIQLNYTWTELNPAYCSFSYDGGVANSSPVAMGDNFTGLTSSQGNNTWHLFCNDTLGNLNISSVTFFKDTIVPTVNITRPQNLSYTHNVTQLNYTFTATNPAYCSYSYDGGSTNSSPVAMGTNFSSLTSSEGNNTWHLFCNDTSGNLNITSVTFYKDSVLPTIDIGQPDDGETYYNKDVPIKITIDEIGHCSFATAGSNIISLSSADNLVFESTYVVDRTDTFIFNAYCNDSLGNNATAQTEYKRASHDDGGTGSGNGASGASHVVETYVDEEIFNGTLIMDLVPISKWRFKEDNKLHILTFNGSFVPIDIDKIIYNYSKMKSLTIMDKGYIKKDVGEYSQTFYIDEYNNIKQQQVSLIVNVMKGNITLTDEVLITISKSSFFEELFKKILGRDIVLTKRTIVIGSLSIVVVLFLLISSIILSKKKD